MLPDSLLGVIKMFKGDNWLRHTQWQDQVANKDNFKIY